MKKGDRICGVLNYSELFWIIFELGGSGSKGFNYEWQYVKTTNKKVTYGPYKPIDYTPDGLVPTKSIPVKLFKDLSQEIKDSLKSEIMERLPEGAKNMDPTD